MMKRNLITICSLSLALLAGVFSCTPVKRGAYTEGSATIFCDDGFRNVLDEEVEVFEYTYPNSSIIPFYMSETAAIDSLLENKTQAIITSRELTQEQVSFMKSKYKRIVRQHCIAVDAVALIVNKDNPVSTLSMNDIRSILTGEISRWNQLAGNDSTKVKLVFDNAGSSTVSFMRDKFLDGKGKIADNPNAYALKNNAEVFDYVKKQKDAIGIISVNWLGDDLSVARKVPLEKRMEDYNVVNDTIATNLTTEVNILKISNPTEENDFSNIGYKPYQAYIYSGEYPLFRKIYMISTASKSTVLHSFYVFMTGTVGQKIISKTGILPYHMNPRVVNLVQKK